MAHTKHGIKAKDQRRIRNTKQTNFAVQLRSVWCASVCSPSIHPSNRPVSHSFIQRPHNTPSNLHRTRLVVHLRPSVRPSAVLVVVILAVRCELFAPPVRFFLCRRRHRRHRHPTCYLIYFRFEYILCARVRAVCVRTVRIRLCLVVCHD